MDAQEIQTLRAMLAAQAAEAAAEKPRLGLLARLRGGRAGGLVNFGLQPAALQSDGDGALLLSEPLDEPVPTEILLGDLAPRRGAFGQRRELALELVEPAPREPARLTLTTPNGQAVGEIILHEAVTTPRPRPFEAPQMETPFFPEDLEDAPGRRSLHRLTAPLPPPAPSPRPKRAAKPSREVAATMLLAGLAARLAHEEAALSARLTGLTQALAA